MTILLQNISVANSQSIDLLPEIKMAEVKTYCLVTFLHLYVTALFSEMYRVVSIIF